MATDTHKEKVSRISAKVREFYDLKKPFRVFHGSTNSTRILSFKADELIDVSDLDEIISIDTKRKVAIVEPNVPMDRLVAATLQHGLIPPVIPEFPGITVGGAIQGGAGESSSFKWGFLSQTTNWVEYVQGDGTVVMSSPHERPDLFYGAAGSCGSLGVITSTELQLLTAKPFVEITYMPSGNFSKTIDMIAERSKRLSDFDFIDAIAFTKDQSLVITGKFIYKPSGKIRRFTRAQDQWFYLHAQEILDKDEVVTECVPIKDYLFRYDRGAFWVGRFAFELFGVPFTRFRRFLLNPILNTRKLYQALQESGASQEYIVQDLTLPIEKSVDFLNYIDSTLAIYPLWICPVKPEPRSPLLCNGIDTELSINIGVWGPRIPDYDEFKRVNRNIEKKLAQADGKKWMYAHTYYTEKEFWNIYDMLWYKELRTAYGATTLPTIYDKVVVKKHYSVNAKRGLYATILGTARLRIEK